MASKASGGSVERLKHLQKVLKQLQKDAHKQTLDSVEVGYTASYALYVHENIEMKGRGKPRRVRKGQKKGSRGRYWDPIPQAQAKFLEQPAREMQSELGRVVKEVYRKTRSMNKSLVAAGLRLQRASQKLVPVDTGTLKNSAFTRVVKGK